MEGRVPEGREEPEARALDAVAEEPLAHRPARLLLHHERQAPGRPLEVDHGVGAGARDAGHGEERELARVEVERPVEIHVEGGHVVGQPAPASSTPAQRGGARRVRVGRLEHADLERAILVRHALAHEQLGRGP